MPFSAREWGAARSRIYTGSRHFRMHSYGSSEQLQKIKTYLTIYPYSYYATYINTFVTIMQHFFEKNLQTHKKPLKNKDFAF